MERIEARPYFGPCFSPLGERTHFPMALLKKVFSRFLPALVRYYVSRERWYRGFGLRLRIAVGVFHPGLFFSTHILLRRLLKEPLAGKSVLELGAGSGLIALVAAQRGAEVLATDINPIATENLKLNAGQHQLSVVVLLSDLFQAVPLRAFNYILINPPYYPREPRSLAGRAWYCGEHFEYFQQLFAQLPPYLGGNVWMILSEDCDLPQIQQLAAAHHIEFHLLETHQNFWEKNFIFQLQRTQNHV